MKKINLSPKSESRVPRSTIIVLHVSLLIFLSAPLLFAPEISQVPRARYTNEMSQSAIRILSWNIAMLPVFDFVQTGKDRASSIGKALLNSGYDIIVFQEAFSAKARRAIYKMLRRNYPYHFGPANAGPALQINSGIWILSRIPLILKQEYKFSGCQGVDCISRKGAMLLEGNWKDQPFQIIGTHLESDESEMLVRAEQLKELFENVLRPYTTPDVPQIICGDFNTDRDISDQYTTMLHTLQCEDGNLSGEENITFGFRINKTVQQHTEKPRQLDYIFTKNTALLSKVIRKVVVITDNWANRKEYLSDHHGIEATIQFGQSEVTTVSLQ